MSQHSSSPPSLHTRQNSMWSSSSSSPPSSSSSSSSLGSHWMPSFSWGSTASVTPRVCTSSPPTPRDPDPTHTVGAAPLALRGLLQLGVQAHQVVGTGAGVAQDDLPALLAHLAVVLVVRLVPVPLFNCKQGTGDSQRGGRTASSPGGNGTRAPLPYS